MFKIYMKQPKQEAISEDSVTSTVSSPFIWHQFAPPISKRCAKHIYIARNIKIYQQLVKKTETEVGPTDNPSGNAAGGGLGSDDLKEEEVSETVTSYENGHSKQ